MPRQPKNFSPEVDAYIEKAAPFAQPILKKLRKLFHQACPEIKEVLKWGVPHFEYKGVLAGMAAFKQHASYGFWKIKLMQDPHGLFASEDTSMGGTKVASIKDLPSDQILLSYIREAIALNESGAKVERPKKGPAKELKLPDDLQAALRKNKSARTTFENFSPSHRNEYIEWITEAKQEATRQKRLATTLVWLSEGKARNWKYMKK